MKKKENKETANKESLHIVMILDKSGSMSSLGKEAVEGCNDFLSKQKKEPGEDLFSLVYFNSEQELKLDAVPLKDAPELKESEYKPRGTTALLDAIGTMISKIEEREEKGLFVIMTDGLENASRHYSYGKINGLIKEKENKGWKFIFLASGIEAQRESKNFAIDSTHVFDKSVQGMKMMFCCASKDAMAFRKEKDKK